MKIRGTQNEPEFDFLFGSPYSKEERFYAPQSDYSAEICLEIRSQGYEVYFDEIEDLIACKLTKGSKEFVSGWGFSREDAAVRAAMRLIQSDAV